jgi:hypothetical protein
MFEGGELVFAEVSLLWITGLVRMGRGLFLMRLKRQGFVLGVGCCVEVGVCAGQTC